MRRIFAAAMIASLPCVATACGVGGKQHGGSSCVDTANRSSAAMLGAVCTPTTVREATNNWCFRDDILVAAKGEFTTFYLSGCPDHAIFEPTAFPIPASNATGRLLQSGLLIRRWLLLVLLSKYGIYTPHFHDYAFTVSIEPRVALTAPYYPTSATLEYGDPIGFAVNGVPIFGAHRYLDKATLEMTFDSCGGHGDRAHRYHYHSAPVCLLRLMGATVPSSLEYLYADGPWWPARGSSPLLGIAIDGFPIYGPYGADGALKRRASLDECNFDNETLSYHFAADAPFAPQCVRGEVRGADACVTKALAARCPMQGVVAGYCLPNVTCAIDARAQCPAGEEEREGWNWLVISLATGFTCFGALILYEVALMQLCAEAASREFTFYDNLLDQRMSPMNIGLSSAMGSIVLLLVSGPLLHLFFNANTDKVESYQNDSTAAYLSVTGVLYALVIAQAFSQVSQRLRDLNMAIADEAAGVHRIYLLVLSLADGAGGKTCHVREKLEIFSTINEYLSITVGELQTGVCDPSPLGMLYGMTRPLNDIVLAAKHKRSLVQVEISNRLMEAISDVVGSRYRRGRLERENLHWSFYVLNLVLCNAMFFGVLLIHTGSHALDLTYCLICVVIIGTTSKIIADIDDPHRGVFQSDHVDIERLLCVVAEVAAFSNSFKTSRTTLTPTIMRARSFAASIAAQEFMPGFRHARVGSARHRKVTGTSPYSPAGVSLRLHRVPKSDAESPAAPQRGMSEDDPADGVDSGEGSPAAAAQTLAEPPCDKGAPLSPTAVTINIVSPEGRGAPPQSP
ncbi:YHYH protein-domain-containing protein [Pelagophyceae sp. CCMP2097]|nr:YHYH protein-domain-containing protein [Pelagophyceae sp. CCMP2097]